MNFQFTAGEEHFKLIYGTIRDYNTTTGTLLMQNGGSTQILCMTEKFAAVDPNSPVIALVKADPNKRTLDEVVNLYNVSITAAQFQKIYIEMSTLMDRGR